MSHTPGGVGARGGCLCRPVNLKCLFLVAYIPVQSYHCLRQKNKLVCIHLFNEDFPNAYSLIVQDTYIFTVRTAVAFFLVW